MILQKNSIFILLNKKLFNVNIATYRIPFFFRKLMHLQLNIIIFNRLTRKQNTLEKLVTPINLN